MNKIAIAISMVFMAVYFGACSSTTGKITGTTSSVGQNTGVRTLSEYLKVQNGITPVKNTGRLPEEAGEGDLEETRYADADSGEVHYMAPGNFGEQLTDRAKGMSLYFGQPVFQFFKLGEDGFCCLTEEHVDSINQLVGRFKTMSGNNVQIADVSPYGLFREGSLFSDDGFEIINDIRACGASNMEVMKAYARDTIVEPIVMEMVRQGYLKVKR